MSERLLFSLDFFKRLQQDGYDVKELSAVIDEEIDRVKRKLPLQRLNQQVKRSVTASVLRSWTSYKSQDIADGLFDADRDQVLPTVQQTLETLALPWINAGAEPPSLTLVQLTRRLNSSPQTIERLIETFAPTVQSGETFFQASFDGVTSKPVKQAIRKARYESRPPGGGPVQKARLVETNLENTLARLQGNRKRIVFRPLPSISASKEESDGGMERGISSGELPTDIKTVIEWLKQQGGKGWLKGVNETEFTETLSRLASGEKTDVVIWNCFDFGWIPAAKLEAYPSCVIKDTVETSIVNFNFPRVMDTLEFLSLLGPITPIALIPTNEAFAQEWNYAQSSSERERVVDSVRSHLSDALNKRSGTIPLQVIRWDRYLQSREVKRDPENLTSEGTRLFQRKLSENPTLRRRVVDDNVDYFDQFGIIVSQAAVEQYVAGYFGVYAGEGIAFAEIAAKRPIILIDLEEGRVARTTIEGASRETAEGNGRIPPIVSPVSSNEKLVYYRWKKQMIQNRKLSNDSND